jgi:hypothetical protein
MERLSVAVRAVMVNGANGAGWHRLNAEPVQLFALIHKHKTPMVTRSGKIIHKYRV